MLQSSLTAPYVDGFALVQELRRRGGWPAVDKALKSLPATTEQLLHLDKLDAREAALAVQLLGVQQVVPIHYGTFPILAGTPDELRAALEARDLGGVQVHALEPGEPVGVDATVWMNAREEAHVDVHLVPSSFGAVFTSAPLVTQALVAETMTDALDVTVDIH